MSRNSNRSKARPSVDRRARRTRMALAEALMSLGAKEGVDRLDVRKLTAAAGVGRSTFYKHYADRDDFFIKSFTGMAASMDAHARAKRPDYDTMLPAHEVFAHVQDARAFAQSLVASGQFARTTAAREDVLRVIAEANLKRLRPALPSQRQQEIAVVLAAAFVSLMRWWVEGGLRKDAAYIAALYDATARRILQG